jgi:molecular chaperone DnaK (HSP70)
MAGEAARWAEIATSQASAAEVSASIAQARFRAGLARQALERDGCR